MLPLDSSDTIAAIASPPGSSARGILRISGRSATSLALDGFLFDGEERVARTARRYEGRLQIRSIRPQVPASIVVWPTARSYTGEPIVEIHTVGSPPILRAILSDLIERGARLAEPGEFTLRAFLCGRIDLTQAEAVLAVIDSQDPRQLESALTQLAGGIGTPIHQLRARLLAILAHLEANLDFVEEADVDPIGRERLSHELETASRELSDLAARLHAKDRPEDCPKVVLVGPPNAGKSQLFNSLVGADQALVSPLAGTTRDYLSARIRCAGMLIELVDTAGTEASVTTIEAQSQGFRKEQARAANLILLCHSADDVPDATTVSDLKGTLLRVVTKCDIGFSSKGQGIKTSGITGEGLDDLKKAIYQELNRSAQHTGAVLETSVRCRESLANAAECLKSGAMALQAGLGDELVAVDLRQTLNELGRIVGAVVTDEILDHIFSRFCIGK